MNHTPANKCGVTCEWLEARRAIVNPDGQVVPCCYLANVLYVAREWTGSEQQGIAAQGGINSVIKREFHAEPVLAEYLAHHDSYNVLNQPLETIINSEWFLKTLPESWDDSDRLVRQCRNFCT